MTDRLETRDHVGRLWESFTAELGALWHGGAHRVGAATFGTPSTLHRCAGCGSVFEEHRCQLPDMPELMCKLREPERYGGCIPPAPAIPS